VLLLRQAVQAPINKRAAISYAPPGWLAMARDATTRRFAG
jgi:hypothetical protein